MIREGNKERKSILYVTLWRFLLLSIYIIPKPRFFSTIRVVQIFQEFQVKKISLALHREEIILREGVNFFG